MRGLPAGATLLTIYQRMLPPPPPPTKPPRAPPEPAEREARGSAPANHGAATVCWCIFLKNMTAESDSPRHFIT